MLGLASKPDGDSARFIAAATASVSCGLTIKALSSSSAAPANCEKDQHPRIVEIQRRDELFGRQIHAVTQWVVIATSAARWMPASTVREIG
jgi:hypothetical protein